MDPSIRQEKMYMLRTYLVGECPICRETRNIFRYCDRNPTCGNAICELCCKQIHERARRYDHPVQCPFCRTEYERPR
jgi:hypothetical protein